MPSPEKGLIELPDPKRTRRVCFWPGDKPDYLAYHDDEWGRPVTDDFRLFEKICLEGFQSGLSWLTILRKRDHFRKAFAEFDFREVAKFGEPDVERLLEDAGIVRHQGKIRSTINNALRAGELVEECGSLAHYFWSYEPQATAERPANCGWDSLRDINQTETSRQLSRDLKQRGWTFVGPTTAYAFMQAMGLVNDHIEGCDQRESVEADRESLSRP